MPKRIQLRHTKGWKKPDGAVLVSRPPKWGNPFTLGHHPLAGFVALQTVGPKGNRTQKEWRAAAVVEAFREWIAAPEQAPLRATAVAELRGKDLCCWCPPGQPCHADVLLEIANQPEATP